MALDSAYAVALRHIPFKYICISRQFGSVSAKPAGNYILGAYNLIGTHMSDEGFLLYSNRIPRGS